MALQEKVNYGPCRFDKWDSEGVPREGDYTGGPTIDTPAEEIPEPIVGMPPLPEGY